MMPSTQDDDMTTDELSFAAVAFGLNLPKPAGCINKIAGILIEPGDLNRSELHQQDQQSPQNQWAIDIDQFWEY